MPILDVDIVGAADLDLAQKIADAAGQVFHTPAGETWVRLRSPDAYAENGGTLPEGVRPVFVSVLKAQPPTGEELALEVQALTEAVAHACGRPPENVHVLYAPAALGRVAFGGRLVAEAGS